MNLIINVFAIFGFTILVLILWTIISDKIDNIKSKKSKVNKTDDIKKMEEMISKKYRVECAISFWDKSDSVRISSIRIGSFIFDEYEGPFIFDNIDNYIRSSFGKMEENFSRIENDYKNLFKDELRDKKLKELGI